jgi:hypothetical protein
VIVDTLDVAPGYSTARTDGIGSRGADDAKTRRSPWLRLVNWNQTIARSTVNVVNAGPRKDFTTTNVVTGCVSRSHKVKEALIMLVTNHNRLSRTKN